mmetsp:Transcript_27746/g.41140  ORF Transcript_27746/g.41140 Transcript_27746/m.41140 type:complete len:116 (+) Transcript_27746:1187-1534(+)
MQCFHNDAVYDADSSVADAGFDYFASAAVDTAGNFVGLASWVESAAAAAAENIPNSCWVDSSFHSDSDSAAAWSTKVANTDTVVAFEAVVVAVALEVVAESDSHSDRRVEEESLR